MPEANLTKNQSEGRNGSANSVDTGGTMDIEAVDLINEDHGIQIHKSLANKYTSPIIKIHGEFNSDLKPKTRSKNPDRIAHDPSTIVPIIPLIQKVDSKELFSVSPNSNRGRNKPSIRVSAKHVSISKPSATDLIIQGKNSSKQIKSIKLKSAFKQ